MINDIDIRGINNIPYTAYEYGNITGKGEYWKCVDGLLICKKTLHYDSYAITYPKSSIYVGGINIVASPDQWGYPFIGTYGTGDYCVFGNCSCPTGNNNIPVWLASYGINGLWVCASDSITINNFYVNLTAIGRWK